MKESLRFWLLFLAFSSGASAAVPVPNERAIDERFAARDYRLAVEQDRNFTRGGLDRGERRAAILTRIKELRADLKSMQRYEQARDALMKAREILDDNVGTWTNWTQACKAISPLQEAIDTSDGIELSSLSAARVAAVKSWGELRDLRRVLGDNCMSTWALKSTDRMRDVNRRIFNYITIDVPTLESERANLRNRLIALGDEFANFGPVGDPTVTDARELKTVRATDFAGVSKATTAARQVE